MRHCTPRKYLVGLTGVFECEMKPQMASGLCGHGILRELWNV